jgi:hypothetical protein
MGALPSGKEQPTMIFLCGSRVYSKGIIGFWLKMAVRIRPSSTIFAERQKELRLWAVKVLNILS